jgi:hypothetical protein
MHEIAIWENRLQREEGVVKGSTRHTFNEDELLPCHYFDYMYGTSTGGLISIMLARLRMTVPQCLEIYRQVGDDLFGHRRNTLPLATKYHHKPLEKAVQRIVGEFCKNHDSCDGHDWHPWMVDEKGEGGSSHSSTVGQTPRICQSICLTATHSGQIVEAYLLRTYDHQYNPDVSPVWITPYNEGAEKLKIWEVTRATSAAPFFFKMLEADFGGGRIMKFKDGGIRENNPSYAAYSEHVSLHGDDHEPGLLLSIGTGRPDTSNNDGFAATWPGPFGQIPFVKKWSEKMAVFKNLLIKYTEGEGRHTMMRAIAKGEHRWYKRLNVDHGLQDMKLDNWEKGPWTNAEGVTKTVAGGKSLTRMEKATYAYLDRDKVEKALSEYAPPKVMLQQTAERLVRHRRAREATKHEDLKRWQTHMGQWLSGDLKDEDGAVQVKPKSTKSSGLLSSKQPIVTGEGSSKQPIVTGEGSSNSKRRAS